MVAMAEESKVLWKRGRTLGKGGFSFVSLASTSGFDDQTLDGVRLPPLIAVKSSLFTHSESLQEENDFLRLFQDSPYIIRCFGVTKTQEDQLVLYNLLLEYASGGSLADCLQNKYSGNGLPEFEVQKHTKNALLGLTRVHSRGIIHCDIKPHNILLVGDDEIAKIADFGLALTLEQTWFGYDGLRGTKRYMAPESVLHYDYGPEVDIWAIGCTVYELLTGEPLWESNEKADVLDRIASEEPKLENEKLSRDAKDFLRSCLVKNPCSRWTADLLLEHPFLNYSKLADSDHHPVKTMKKKSYMSILRRPHQKRAFKTQPHVRGLIIE